MPRPAQEFSSGISEIFLVLRIGLMLVSAFAAYEDLAPIAPVDVLIAEAPRALAAFSARFV